MASTDIIYQPGYFTMFALLHGTGNFAGETQVQCRLRKAQRYFTSAASVTSYGHRAFSPSSALKVSL